MSFISDSAEKVDNLKESSEKSKADNKENLDNAVISFEIFLCQSLWKYALIDDFRQPL